MDFAAFIMILFFALSCNLVLASPAHRFDPKTQGNLIGITIISGVAFLLLCLLGYTVIRSHRVTIKAYFRLRNPSIRALAPDSGLSLNEPNPDGARPVQLDNLSADSHPSVSMRGFLIGTAISDEVEKAAAAATVRPRPSLVGLGIMTGRSEEPVITPPPRALIHGGRVSFGVGWQPPYDEAFARFGPPPTPPPTSPVPPIPPVRDARRRVPYLPAAAEEEEAGPSGTTGRFAAGRSFSAGL